MTEERRSFEQVFPVPTGVRWSNGGSQQPARYKAIDADSNPASAGAAYRQQLRWEGWRARGEEADNGGA